VNIPVPPEKLTGTGSVRSQKRKERLALDHLYSDPLPTVQLPQDKADQRELPHVLVISGLESTSYEVHDALLKALCDRQIVLDGPDDKDRGTYNLPDGFFIVCVCPAGDGRERPALHKSLLDRFSTSAFIDLDSNGNHPSPTSNPLSASRDSDRELTSKAVHPILSREELLALQTLATPERTHIHPRLSLYISDLISGARHHPHLDGTLLTSRCHAQMAHILRAWRVLFGPIPVPADQEIDEDEESQQMEERGDASVGVLDVTDEDVKNVYPRVVAHRVRVRNGPADELLSGAIFGAIFNGEERLEWVAGRRAVADILKEVVHSI